MILQVTRYTRPTPKIISSMIFLDTDSTKFIPKIKQSIFPDTHNPELSLSMIFTT